MEVFKIIWILQCITINNVIPAVIGKLGSTEVFDNALNPIRTIKQITPLSSNTNLEDVETVKQVNRNAKPSLIHELQPRRHIDKVPQPPYPLFDDPPSGLFADQKHSTSKVVDDSISSQRRAFIVLLNKHQRHPKRSRKIMENRYIILSYDYKTKTYSIREEESEE